MSDGATARLLPVKEAYQLWAAKYDSALNPLIRLEERTLAPLLKAIVRCDVVDLGCGTGRWLKQIAALRPRSLTGVDFSPAMLRRAAKAIGPGVRFVESDCLNMPLDSDSADLILASFLLSYLEDLDLFARETARIARTGALAVLSDVHPATRRYGWKRTFRSAQQLIEIQTREYDADELHKVMKTAGFELESFREYCFGDEEKRIFEKAGHPDFYEKVDGLKVLWIACYRKEGQ